MKNYLLMIALLAAFSLFTACQEEPEIELTPFDTEITNGENDPDFFQKLTFYLLFLFMEILYCKVSDHGSL